MFLFLSTAAMPDFCSKCHKFFRFCWASWICSSVLRKFSIPGEFNLNSPMQEAHVESCSWNYKLLTSEDKTEKRLLDKKWTRFPPNRHPSCFCIWSLLPQKKAERGINWRNPSSNWCSREDPAQKKNITAAAGMDIWRQTQLACN